MIEVSKDGRNLVLIMDGVDPFVIRPLPGNAGVQVTETYLQSMTGATVDLIAALQMCVDGAVLDGDTWKPKPEAEQTNFNRIGMELSQTESEEILMPAFFWQTILGMDGVKAYVEGGGGLSGTLKASGAMTARLGLLARRKSPKASVTD